MYLLPRLSKSTLQITLW